MGVILLAVLVAVAFGVSTNRDDDVARDVVATHQLEPQGRAPSSTADGVPLASAFGVAFPGLAAPDGWRPVARRIDEVGDCPVVTVFYGGDGRRLAYSVVGGAPLAAPSGARRVDGGSPTVLVFDAGGRTAVMATRHGHSVVISAVGVSLAALVRAARTMPRDG